MATEQSDGWILHHRPAKNRVDPTRPYAFFSEKERTHEGHVEDVLIVLLTNSECPFCCMMCDLWKNTTDEPVPVGAIPGQIHWALERLPAARHIKLYNSGSFFDPQAIPEADYEAIAETVRSFQTIVVESHPKMIGRRCRAFADMVGGRLQVAMGLETVHPGVLGRLNKRMTLADFARATSALLQRGILTRAFILLRPPFLSEQEGVHWAKRSIDFAFDNGVECCVVIPTRAGNGAIEALAAVGQFQQPTLESLEEVLRYGVALRRGRVLADLWDVERQAGASLETTCRVERMRYVNLTQNLEPCE